MVQAPSYPSKVNFPASCWPRYRGRRSGKQVKDRERLRRHHIYNVSPRSLDCNPSNFWSSKSHNPANCVSISPQPSVTTNGPTGLSKVFVPGILLSNVMSLAPKIDEVSKVIQNANVDVACITETWLRSHIHDNIVSIHGYNLVRRDRTNSQHGGVCVYVRNSIKFQILEDMMDTNFEVIWLQLRPTRLPRGMPSIIIANVYHTPSAENSAMLNYLHESMSAIESRFPNSGYMLLGDFDKLETSRLRNRFRLKHIVKFPTRGQNTLDLILTNLKDLYDTPAKHPPFGLSDHATIVVHPLARSLQPTTKATVKSRDLRPTTRLAMRTYLEAVDIQVMVDSQSSCEEKSIMLEKIVNTGLDIIAPLKSKTVRLNEPPWMNSSLKQLIRRRQQALANGESVNFRSLRNQVNRQRKACRSKYYQHKVQYLKNCKPTMWWKEVKKLSGLSPSTSSNLLTDLQFIATNQVSPDVSQVAMANKINSAFLAPMN